MDDVFIVTGDQTAVTIHFLRSLFRSQEHRIAEFISNRQTRPAAMIENNSPLKDKMRRPDVGRCETRPPKIIGASRVELRGHILFGLALKFLKVWSFCPSTEAWDGMFNGVKSILCRLPLQASSVIRRSE